VVRIGSEAIRDISLHSGAKKLEVKIRYGHELTIRVGDNGERGERVRKTRSVDLTGMQDRAARIGGQVRMFSHPNSGRAIELKVPGRIAFHGVRQWRFLAKLRGLEKGTDGDGEPSGNRDRES
jgi:nitrate/nitrite-specific signal transduction histidine kinase